MQGKEKNNYKYEIVAEQILNEIKDGRWTAGDKLPSESQLMDEYHVSRVTLREALKKLAALEILDIVQGDGTYVKRFHVSNYMKTAFSLLSISENNISDIYDARIFIESGMAGMAARNRSEEDVRKLSHMISRMEEEIAFNRFVEYSRYDERFHKYIYELSNNKIMIMMSEMFLGATTTYTQRLNGISLIAERSMLDHRQIFYAIEEKDSEYASMCMKRHLEYSRNQLLKIGIS